MLPRWTIPQEANSVTKLILSLMALALTAHADPWLLDLKPAKKQSLSALAAALKAGGKDIAGVDFERKLVVVAAEEPTVAFPDAELVEARFVARVPDRQYFTPEKLTAKLKELAAAHPDSAELRELGKSLEGRPIWGFRVRSPQAAVRFPRPAVMVDAMHHAREVMTVEIAVDLIEQLLSRRANDARIEGWLQAFDVWVIPMVNPDGNARVWAGSTMWRKNTRGGYGVDINRNYPTNFGACRGSSSSFGADDYRGPSAASEPETKVVMELADEITPSAYLSYHTFSEIVIHPYGCPGKLIEPEFRAKHLELSRGIAAKLIRDSGSGSYIAGASYELLYPTDGGSIDHIWRKHRAYSFVVEANSSRNGFQPSYALRDTTVRRQRLGWAYLFDSIRDLVQHPQ